MKGKRKKYTNEFKDSAVQLVLSGGRSAAQVVRDLGLPEWQVGAWVRAIKKNGGTTSSTGNPETDMEVLRLKKELKKLQEEHEILKRQRRSLRKINPKERLD